MASSSNMNRGNAGQNQNAALLNYSLGGNLTVDQLTGPMLFTPVPLSSPTLAPETTTGNTADVQEQSFGQTGFPFTGAVDHTQDFTTVQSPQQVSLPSNQLQNQPLNPSTYSVQNPAFQPDQPYVGNASGIQFPTSTPPHFAPFHDTVPQQVNQYQSSPGMQYVQDSFSSPVTGQDVGESNISQISSSFRPTQVVPPQPQPPTQQQQPGQQLQQQQQQFPVPVHPPRPQVQFFPVQPHWFFLKDERIWAPFSFVDSINLEAVYQSHGNIIVPTDGGRYDIDLDSLTREAVYWEEQPCSVKRCTWFYKGDAETKLVPYEENIASILEREYKSILTTNSWNKKVDLPRGEYAVFHNANVIVHYRPSSGPIDWTGEDSQARPKVVRRGIADIENEIHEGEPTQVDYLVLCVHGIGPVADLSGRSIIECVDDMRQHGLLQMGTHQFAKEDFSVGRVEFLPIQWYFGLHNDKSGIDDRLKAVTLGSIVKFREFTNATLTDILFFTSPMYCQTICDTVANEMNRILQLFQSRNPGFQGGVSVLGHSLGSCILFDILANQNQDKDSAEEHQVTEELIEKDVVINPQTMPTSEVDGVHHSKKTATISQSSSATELNSQEKNQYPIPEIETVLNSLGLQDLLTKFQDERMDTETLIMCSESDIKDLGIPMGPRKKLMGFIRDQLRLQDQRRIEHEQRSTLKRESELGPFSSIASPGQQPTAERRIFICKGTQTSRLKRSHSVFCPSPSVQITYEKGVAGTGQPHVNFPKLDFSPTHFFALGSPISLFLTVRGVSSIGVDFNFPTCRSFLNIFHPYDPVAYRIEPLVNPELDCPPVLIPHHKGRKRFHLELRENIERVGANLRQGFIQAVRNTWTSINEFAKAHRSEAELEIGEETTETAVVAPLQPQELNESFNEEQVLVESTSPAKHIDLGNLNQQKRIDYVLQERPFEILNEYLFALSSHTCYWSSEDTALLMLREIYGAE